MCGIAGICLPVGYAVQNRKLQSLADAMAHRGPDEEGFFISDNRQIGFAHRRLSVIDVETGKQPIFNEDGSIVAIFNGEIYNFESLRRTLVLKGHRFNSKTDSEVIVHLYEEHGFRCMEHLRGMFAFVIYDVKQDLVFGCIDRMGKKPFFYSQIGPCFYFASSFDALLELSEIPRELDPDALDDFLSLTYIPPPKTIFLAVQKLKPAHFFVWQKGELRIDRYWDIRAPGKLDISLSEAKTMLMDKIEEAVRCRLISDVPLGAFLSGGIDSSLVVALASKYVIGGIDTFSIGFEESSFNELPYARMVAKQYQTNHHEFIVAPMEVDTVPEIVKHFGEPFGDFSSLPMWSLSRETKKFVTVALSGDGADELFGGYNRHKMFLIYNFLRNTFPEKFLLNSSRLLRTPKCKHTPFRRLQRLLQIISQGPASMFWDLNTFLKPWQKEFVYTDNFKALLSSSGRAKFLEIFDGFDGSDLEKALYTDALTYELCQLTKVDVMSMAWSLEVRCPFVDQELVEFAYALPDSFKVRFTGGKLILKSVAEEYLPKRILERPKQGFTAPLELWFRDELKDYAKEKILYGELSRLEWLNMNIISEMLTQHFSGKGDFTYNIWNFLILSEWMDLYM
jgi:asparagine synthase (glutamine-hydrolysing)